MQYVYEAIRPDGSTVSELIEAGDRGAAVESLREKGLIILRLDQEAAASDRSRTGRPNRLLPLHLHSWPVTVRDRILFTRQMKMLLEAGTPLVPALEAAQQQTTKPTMRDILGRLRERVEEGDSLSEALEAEGECFDPVFRSMVAAGEATASLPQIFGRLAALTQQQQKTRQMVVGALLYPAILSIMLVGVVAVLLFGVVPRFKMLFTSLNSPLPATTELLFGLSELARQGWPYLLGGVAGALAALVLCFHLPPARGWLDQIVLRLPLVGRLVSRLIFARVLRVWAAMLRCHVPLLETIRQSRTAVTNAAFLRLIADVEEMVSSGGRMGQALGAVRLADPIIVSAIRTGEENGRLAEATDFVSSWMDEDNAAVTQHVTRLAEPVLLAVMGVVVGFVALCLFVPLFDLATAGG